MMPLGGNLMANYSDYSSLKSAILTGTVTIETEGYAFNSLIKKPDVVQSENLYRAALDVIKEANKEYKTSHKPEAMEKLVRAYNVLSIVERKSATGVFAFFKNLKESYELNSALKTTEHIFTSNFDQFVAARVYNIDDNVTLEAALDKHIAKVETAIKEFKIPAKEWKDLKLALAQERKADAKIIWNSIIAQIRVETGTLFKSTKQVEDFLFDKLPIQDIIKNPNSSLEQSLVNILKGYSHSKPNAQQKEVQTKLTFLLLKGDEKALKRFLQSHRSLPEIDNLLKVQLPENPADIQDNSDMRTVLSPHESIARNILGKGKVLHVVQDYYNHFPHEFQKDHLTATQPPPDMLTIQGHLQNDTLEKVNKFLEKSHPDIGKMAAKEISGLNEKELGRLYFLITKGNSLQDLIHLSPSKPFEIIRDEALFFQHFPEGEKFNPILFWISSDTHEPLEGLSVLKKLAQAIPASSNTDLEPAIIHEEDKEFIPIKNNKGQTSTTSTAGIKAAKDALTKKIVDDNVQVLNRLQLSPDDMRLLGPAFIKAIEPENIPKLKVKELTKEQLAAITPEQADKFTSRQWKYLTEPKIYTALTPEAFARISLPPSEIKALELIKFEPTYLLAFIKHHGLSNENAEELWGYLAQKQVHPSDASVLEEIKKQVVLSLLPLQGARDRIQELAENVIPDSPATNLIRMLEIMHKTRKNLRNDSNFAEMRGVLLATKEKGMFNIFETTMKTYHPGMQGDFKPTDKAALDKLKKSVDKSLQNDPQDKDLLALKAAIAGLERKL